MRAVRHILVDARTQVNYTMFAPVHRAMKNDPRVRFSFIASEEPRRAREIYRDAPAGTRIVGPMRAALTKFDAYVASDFMWTQLPRGTCRIQMFHGVGGKYGFDAPTESLSPWDRLFFVNRRRLRNCVAAGAIAPDSPAVRLVGMPKVDCLVDGSLTRDGVLDGLGLDPRRPTVLYTPTWSPASSLNDLGEPLVRRLLQLPINVIVKLHDRSRDLRQQYSGAVDWSARLTPLLSAENAHLASSADVCPYLVAADLMITDHSSCGFEYLLLDRPLVRIHRPDLIELARIHRDYVALLAEAAESVNTVAETVAAVESGLSAPAARAARRRAIAADLFHQAGTATMRCAAALYEAIELGAPDRLSLDVPSLVNPAATHSDALCQPSA
jgi:CDP-glycerol glycerophosphotransferase (TagB/SpsB family)